MRRIASALRALRVRIARLPPPVLLALAGLLITGAAVAGVLMYRTYNYVQHDNNFCMSCHLMAEPFERFAKSAHRGLGCKACHRPTMQARSTMALTQILDQPEELKTHAEVPNEVCAECHIDGNPEDWRIISASAGHRVHFESADAKLQGLQCVQCHSSSVHEFSTTDATCGQSGCHEQTKVTLGKMGQLTIHCASCHEFNRPVARTATADTLALALRPRREQCLSCHAMRNLVSDFPADDPHGGACGACHDPHKQTTPAQAVESCATAGCHARMDTITPFHRGLDPGQLATCTSCHDAHAFHATTECAQCHAPITHPVTPRLAGAGAASTTLQHAQHVKVQCAACHNSSPTHGAVALTTFSQCRQCHHTGDVAQTCTNCHARAELTQVAMIAQPVRIAGRAATTKQVPFDHRVHVSEQCTACHAASPDQRPTVSCNSCHEKHHTANNTCMTCHSAPRPNTHNARAHVTCAGAGCHSGTDFARLQRTRPVCLSCHQTLAAHMPGRNCIDCHALPAPRGGGGGGALNAHALPVRLR